MPPAAHKKIFNSEAMVSKILLLAVGAAMISVPVAYGAQPPQPPRIRADVVVMGFVPCNNGTSMRAGSAPGFPNALVQLRCRDDAGAGATAVVANATTDGRGRFRMAMNATAALSTSSVASACGLVVATPLVSCDAALPAAGTLESGLRLLVGVVFFPRGFSYVVPPLDWSAEAARS